MEKERAKLLDELLNQIDRAYDLMEEYDSISRKYGEVILYQVEAHLNDDLIPEAEATVASNED